ncbi:MAG: type 4a pilus biogenesis protein PilO [Candidatus Omnitrophica bacterium]|nr:type 4a pilus biogenesis protein PilO [Candidatus Omnitrophota bacterium]
MIREKVVIIVGAVIVIVGLGLYLFLYHPLARKLKTVRAECKVAEEEICQAQEAMSFLKVTDIRRGPVAPGETSLAINELTRQGKLNGINFLSITPKAVEKCEWATCEILPIEMEIESSFGDLGIFLGSVDDLEKSLVTVNEFYIIPESRDARKLKTKLVLDIYIE